MTEIQQQPGTLPWVQFREDMLTARETPARRRSTRCGGSLMSIQ